MKRLRPRFLACLLAFQQLTFATPALALNNGQFGKPFDSSALKAANSWSSPVAASHFTGAATFRVPILTPPGTGGLAPQVALVYNSDASQISGAFGSGWSLDVGFPKVIERSTRDGAPAYDDETDTFELDGFRLKETATSGQYVTENFDFQRIERIPSGSDDYWRVLRPDGTRLYYGYEDDGVTNLSILHNI